MTESAPPEKDGNDAGVDLWVFVRSTHWRTHFYTDPADPAFVILEDYVADEPVEGDRVYENLSDRDETMHELHLIPGGLAGLIRKGINAGWEFARADKLFAAGRDKQPGELIGTHRMRRLDR